MTAPAPTKLGNVQALRGFAALLVVLSHIPGMETKHGGDALLPGYVHLGISGVDLFFAISGFIMVYITWKTPPALKNTMKFLFARVTRIYPLYWVIAVAVFAMWSFKPSLMTFDPERTSLLKSFLLWPDQTLPMLKVAWTLIHELYFYLVFAIILFLPHRVRLIALTFWAALIIGAWQLGWWGPSPESKLIFHPLSIEFFMGAVAGWIYRIWGKAGMAALGVGLALWIIGHVMLALGFDYTDVSTFPTNWERVLYFGIPATFIVYGLAVTENQYTMPKWSVALGDWSYSLYLTHVLVISVIGYVWRQFAVPGPIDNIVMIIVMIAGCIVGAAVSWFMIEKPFLSGSRHLRRRWFG